MNNNHGQSNTASPPHESDTDHCQDISQAQIRQCELKIQKQYQQSMLNYFKTKMLQQQILRTSIIEEVHSYINAQMKYKNSLQNNKYVYIVSYNWVKKWKQQAKYQVIKNRQAIEWDYRFSFDRLGCMNQDLIDHDFQVTLKFQDQKNYLNVVLKKDLKEGQHYICVNEEIWNIFKHYKHIEIKRQVIRSQNLKFIEYWPLKITLLIISNRIIKQINNRVRQRIPMEKLQFSRYSTIAYFQLMHGQILSKMLELDEQERSLEQASCYKVTRRFMLVQSNFSVEKIHKRLLSSIDNQEKVNSYSLCLPIQQLNYKMEFCKQVNEDHVTLVCQLQQQKQDKNIRICYSPKNSCSFGHCPKCKQLKKLLNPCKCKYIAYCSENCQNTDIAHIKKCANKVNQYKNGNQLSIMKRKNGLVGLSNIGNTCFMNSGIQCISNIYELTQYFISGRYSDDINHQNPHGTRGSLSNAFANVLKKIWCDSISHFSPNQFKRSIESYQKMFQGYSQHDSGQFISYLLQGLHEDLKRNITNIPKIQQKEIDERPQHVIADEQWKSHLLKNNSKIIELMYGQYRSKVICSKCDYKSVQFDPFGMCSVPIPDENYRLFITFQDDINLSQQKIVYFYKSTDLVSNALRYIRNKKGVANNTKFLVYNSKTQIYSDQLIKTIVTRYKVLYVRRYLEEQKQNGCRVYINYREKKLTEFMPKYQLFATKLYRFNPEITFAELHEILYKYNKKLIEVGQAGNSINQPKAGKILIQIQPVQLALTCLVCRQRCKGCQLPYSKQKIGIFLTNKCLTLKYTIKQKLPKEYSKPNQMDRSINLIDCINAFEEPQTLTNDNAWHCPKCKEKVSAKKKIMIYKAPKILIFCLKRFKPRIGYVQKNQSLIHFAIKELDLSDKVLKTQLPFFSTNQQTIKSLGQQRQNQKRNQKEKSKLLYELFAVSHHSGNVEEGHYISTCKNIGKNSWFQFDDHYVRPISETEIVKNSAYILFYRRK